MTLIEKLIALNFDEKKAKSLIMSGSVYVNEIPIIVGSTKINDKDIIRIKETKEYVSRGAYKLLEGLDKFNLNVENKNCLDIGSSTGGFTQVLLQHGANKIYSLDVGTNQLDYKLRTNPKVVVLEKTNLKNINKNMFSESIDFVCCDVSFISTKYVFDVLANDKILSKENNLIILIKPQFEAKKEWVQKGGYIDEKYHQEIIENVCLYAQKNQFNLIKIIPSPILGNKSKNKEYLAWFKRG